MKSYIPLETAAIFFLANLFPKQGIWSALSRLISIAWANSGCKERKPRITKWTRHVFVKHRCPRRQQSWNMAKISKSYILTPPHPQGHVMPVKCDEPIDEPTVQVLLLYHHPNFKYCTLFVSGTELRTDKQTDKQTDRQTNRRTIQLLDAPRGPFRPGAYKFLPIPGLELTIPDFQV